MTSELQGDSIQPEDAVELLLIDPFRQIGIEVDFWRERPAPSIEEWGLIVAWPMVRNGRLGSTLTNSFDATQKATAERYLDRLGAVQERLREAVQLGSSIDSDKRSGYFRELLDLGSWPHVHTELGTLLLLAAGLEPLTPLDFRNQEISLPAAIDTFEVLGDETPPDLLHETVHGIGAAIDRTTALRLSTDAYGRAYAHYVRTSAARSKLSPRDDWSFYLTLDGLRLALMELDRLDLAELVCIVYSSWYQIRGYPARWDDASGAAPNPFERRFGKTSGYITGRRAVSAVAEAQELVHATSQMQERELVTLIAMETGRVPKKEVAHYENVLGKQLGSIWAGLPRSVQSHLAQAEYLWSVSHPADFDWAPVAVQYSRAIEMLLRQTIGEKLDGFLQREGRHGRMFRDRFFPRHASAGTANLILKDFVRLLDRAAEDPLFQRFVEGEYRGKEMAIRTLPAILRELVRDVRNPAAHGPSKIAGALVGEVRKILFEGTSSQQGLLSLLSGHS